jgi:hypothetical protein
MKRLSALLLPLFAALLVILPGGGGSAHANGVPQLVKLTYLDGVSNFGPKDAEGVLEFSFAEAYARIELKNLVPVAGYTYEGWLTGGEGAPFPIGKIALPASGVGSVETKLDGLQRYDYNLFVVTARADGATGDTMPAQKSIAGRFALISDTPAGQANGDVRPGLLPNTGEKSAGFPWARAFYSVGAMGVAATIILSARRARRRPGR